MRERSTGIETEEEADIETEIGTGTDETDIVIDVMTAEGMILSEGVAARGATEATEATEVIEVLEATGSVHHGLMTNPLLQEFQEVGFKF